MHRTLAALLMLVAVARAGDQPTAVNSQDGVALHGYDPVAYFTAATPTPGLERYTYEWRGVSYRFASAANLAAFRAQPERFAPQYGGYCAMAMSLDRIADVDPTQWAVVGGKLYLNNNPKAQALWSTDREGHITAADANWSHRATDDECDVVCRAPGTAP